MLLINPDWLINVKRFYRRYPGRSILAVVALAISVWLLLLHHYLHAALAFNIVVQCLITHKHSTRLHQAEFVPVVLAELKIEHNMLHVKHRQLNIEKVKKIVVDQIDKQHAIIDFPFNVYGKLTMRFPACQLPAVKDWVSHHLPHTKIIR